MFFLRYFPLSIIFPFFYSKEKMEGKRCNERRRRRISFVLLEDAERAKYANIERRKHGKNTLARDFYAVVCACKI